MASKRLNVFKLATDKLVYVTKISEEIVVVIANTSELNRRIELTPNRFVALFSDLHETLILSSLTVDTHRRKSLSIAQKFSWLRLDIFIAFCQAIVLTTVLYAMPGVASLNTFKRSVAIANSDLTTLWTRRYTL